MTFRIGTVFDLVLRADFMTFDFVFEGLLVTSILHPASRAATRAASAFALSRLSPPRVDLRRTGEGGLMDLVDSPHADRIDALSGPPKRIVRLFKC